MASQNACPERVELVRYFRGQYPDLYIRSHVEYCPMCAALSAEWARTGTLEGVEAAETAPDASEGRARPVLPRPQSTGTAAAAPASADWPAARAELTAPDPVEAPSALAEGPDEPKSPRPAEPAQAAAESVPSSNGHAAATETTPSEPAPVETATEPAAPISSPEPAPEPVADSSAPPTNGHASTLPAPPVPHETVPQESVPLETAPEAAAPPAEVPAPPPPLAQAPVAAPAPEPPVQPPLELPSEPVVQAPVPAPPPAQVAPAAEAAPPAAPAAQVTPPEVRPPEVRPPEVRPPVEPAPHTNGHAAAAPTPPAAPAEPVPPVSLGVPATPQPAAAAPIVLPPREAAAPAPAPAEVPPPAVAPAAQAHPAELSPSTAPAPGAVVLTEVVESPAVPTTAQAPELATPRTQTHASSAAAPDAESAEPSVGGVATTTGRDLRLVFVGVLIAALAFTTYEWRKAVSAAQLARAQAEGAERVQALLPETLAGQGLRDGPVTLRQVLDWTSPRLSSELEPWPDAELRAREHYVDLYEQLGDWVGAEGQRMLSLRIEAELAGGFDEEIARRVLHSAADIGERAEAASLGFDNEQHDWPILGFASREQGVLPEVSGRHKRLLEQGRAALADAAEFAVANGSEDSHFAIECMRTEAALLRLLDEGAAAKSKLAKAWQLIVAREEEQPEQSARVLAELVSALYELGRADDAVALGKKLVPLVEEAYGAASLEALIARNNYGVLRHASGGKGKEVEAEFQAILEEGEGLLEFGDWRLGMFRGNLGRIILDQGRDAEAQSELLGSYSTLQAALGDDHFWTRRAAFHAIEMFLALGEDVRAERLRGRLGPR